jgi:hypothetical protein
MSSTGELRVTRLGVFRSAAGYYIGTKTQDGIPYCRLSSKYWTSEEGAASALISDSYDRRDYECLHCRYYMDCGR